LKLLTSAAQSYDRSIKPTPGSHKHRTVLAHDTYEEDPYDYYGYGYGYETPMATGEANIRNIGTDIQHLMSPDPDPTSYDVYQASHGVRRPGRHHSNARSD